MSRASSLYRLQALDLELDRTRSRLSEIETALSDDEALPRTRKELLEAEARLQALRSAARGAEHNVTAHQAKLEQAEAALYSGSIRNPKELQDLQHEVEALRRFKPTLEDRLLDAMVDLEEAELQCEALGQEAARLEALLATKRSSLLEERGRAMGDVERLQAEREAALASVPDADNRLYSQLRETRGGVAVALLQDDSCSACGLTQAHSLRQSIRMGPDLVCCKQCGRILYAG